MRRTAGRRGRGRRRRTREGGAAGADGAEGLARLLRRRARDLVSGVRDGADAKEVSSAVLDITRLTTAAARLGRFDAARAREKAAAEKPRKLTEEEELEERLRGIMALMEEDWGETQPGPGAQTALRPPGGRID